MTPCCIARAAPHAGEAAACRCRAPVARVSQSVSLDLIFGTPGESLASWRRTRSIERLASSRITCPRTR